MGNEHEPFISQESELKRIREKKFIEFKEKIVVSGGPLHVTDADFDDVVKKNTLAMVDFWASWCGPCMALAPTIEEVAKEYGGRVLVGKLNVDENPKTAECFQVYSIPTMVIMRYGQEVERIVGCVQKKIITAALDKHLRKE